MRDDAEILKLSVILFSYYLLGVVSMFQGSFCVMIV